LWKDGFTEASLDVLNFLNIHGKISILLSIPYFRRKLQNLADKRTKCFTQYIRITCNKTFKDKFSSQRSFRYNTVYMWPETKLIVTADTKISNCWYNR